MGKHVVFLGNCQALALRGVFHRFVRPYHDLTTDYVDAFEQVTESSYDRLRLADIVVAQCSLQPPRLGEDHIPAGAVVHRVPLVSGAFIWPFHCVPHPLHPTPRRGNPPYTPEYNDRHLAKLLISKVSPDDALVQYKAFDVAKAAHVGRVRELTLEGQRRLDLLCGYDVAGIIEGFLQDEPLFQSAYHFGTRIGRHIAATLCDRMGFDAKYGQRINAYLHEMPFVPRYVPVHPSVARYFGMRWARDDTRYKFLWEGGYKFDEYVRRFMQGQWSEALQEGIMDASAGLPQARAKLEAGLREAPRSALGHHELSRILEKEGDVEGSLALQERAAELEMNDKILIRLGQLLRRAGDAAGAADAFRRATIAAGANPMAWALLRDVLFELGRLQRAEAAAQRAVEFAVDPAPAQAVLERIRKKLGHRNGMPRIKV